MESNTRGRLSAIRLAGLALCVVWVSSCVTAQARTDREDVAKRARSHLDLGVDHLGAGRIGMAFRELQTAETLDPKNPRIQYALGDAYLRKGLTGEAEGHLVRAVALYPDFHDARLHLSALYIHLKRFDESIGHSQVLADDPTFSAPWRALTNRGWAEFRSGRVQSARASFREALAYHGKYWPAILDLAILQHQEGEPYEAIQGFRRVLEFEPGPGPEAEVNYRLAEIYVSLGKRDRAVGHLRTAVARTPTGEWGRRSEEYLRLLR